MKITKSQLRQIIKEEINNQLLSEAPLNEGVKEFVDKAMLVVFLSAFGAVGAGAVGGAMEANQIQQALEDAAPQDLEQAERALAKYLSCERLPTAAKQPRPQAATDWIKKSQEKGTGGF